MINILFPESTIADKMSALLHPTPSISIHVKDDTAFAVLSGNPIRTYYHTMRGLFIPYEWDT